MGNRLFNRKGRIVFTPPGAVNGIAVENLRLRFKVEKTLEPNPNKAAVAIYNMSETNRSLAESKPIVSSSSDGGKIQTPGYLLVDACYFADEDLQNKKKKPPYENVFAGDISRVITRYEGADIITEFESGDGEKAFKDARADMTFGAGANFKDMLSTLAGKMGLQLGEVSGVKSQSFLNGYTVSGPIRKVFDTLAKTQDLEWSIQDGKLQFIKAGAAVQKEAVLISPATGLIGSPKKKDQGFEVTSLLQPRLSPGRLVAIESKFIKGNVFRVLKVTHEGDTHDQNWYSTIEIAEVTA